MSFPSFLLSSRGHYKSSKKHGISWVLAGTVFPYATAATFNFRNFRIWPSLPPSLAGGIKCWRTDRSFPGDLFFPWFFSRTKIGKGGGGNLVQKLVLCLPFPRCIWCCYHGGFGREGEEGEEEKKDCSVILILNKESGGGRGERGEGGEELRELFLTRYVVENSRLIFLEKFFSTTVLSILTLGAAAALYGISYQVLKIIMAAVFSRIK